MNRIEKINAIKNGKPFRISDIFVLAGIVALAALMLFLTYFGAAKGAEVAVTVGGAPYGRYSLSTDRTENIDGKLTLVIKDGYCYVTDPVCPDHICAYTGRIGNVNQTIVCAPEQIVIRIAGASDIHGGAG